MPTLRCLAVIVTPSCFARMPGGTVMYRLTSLLREGGGIRITESGREGGKVRLASAALLIRLTQGHHTRPHLKDWSHSYTFWPLWVYEWRVIEIFSLINLSSGTGLQF
jgi:hypothetical protein